MSTLNKQVKNAILIVERSYHKKNHINSNNQILVQKQTKNIIMTFRWPIQVVPAVLPAADPGSSGCLASRADPAVTSRSSASRGRSPRSYPFR